MARDTKSKHENISNDRYDRWVSKYSCGHRFVEAADQNPKSTMHTYKASDWGSDTTMENDRMRTYENEEHMQLIDASKLTNLKEQNTAR